LEPPRRSRFGEATALIGFQHERVLLRSGGDGAWMSLTVGRRAFVRGQLATADAFARRRGAVIVLRARSIQPLQERRGGIAGALDHVRTRAEQVLERDVPLREGALLQGMVLGDDHRLPSQLRDDFRAAGLTHLTAASGQNVMLLAALTAALTTSLGIGLRPRLAVALAVVGLYVPLAGGGPSIQRAGVMGAVGVVAGMVGRPASRWYALGLAAAVTLALDPRTAIDPGWQMSFAAVAAIFVVGGRLRDRLAARRVPRQLAEAMALTLAAGAATAPIIAWHFHRVSLVSPIANVLAVPAVGPVMWLGMVAATIGQASPAAGALLAAGAAVPAGYLARLAHLCAVVPGAAVTASAPVVVMGLAVLVAVFASRRGRRLAIVCAATAGLAVVAWPRGGATGGGPPRHLRVTFLDVGQGDATLLQDGDASVLVDTGPPAGHVVARLRHAGVRRLDVLVITHAQLDHDGGAPSVLAGLPVGLVVDGRDGVRSAVGDEIAAAASRLHLRMLAPAAGQVIRVGRIDLRILWPRREPVVAHVGVDPNERAIVSLVCDGGVRVLLTADVESDVLGALDLPPVDVLKVSHHGSADIGLPALLARLRPTVAVISVGARNLYGHPAPATIRALSRAVPDVYRTDRDGTVAIDAGVQGLVVHRHA
jgi:competence protein ComEC